MKKIEVGKTYHIAFNNIPVEIVEKVKEKNRVYYVGVFPDKTFEIFNSRGLPTMFHLPCEGFCIKEMLE